MLAGALALCSQVHPQLDRVVQKLAPILRRKQSAGTGDDQAVASIVGSMGK